MNNKALVVYATRAGSTGDVAHLISERLCAMGFDAEDQIRCWADGLSETLQ